MTFQLSNGSLDSALEDEPLICKLFLLLAGFDRKLSASRSVSRCRKVSLTSDPSAVPACSRTQHEAHMDPDAHPLHSAAAKRNILRASAGVACVDSPCEHQ
jgi:hypothetical protein